MSSSFPKPSDHLTNAIRILGSTSSAVYGIVAITLVTIAYSALRIAPLVRHDIYVLEAESSTASRAARLDDQLLQAMQQSRHSFLAAIISSSQTEERNANLLALGQANRAVAETESQLGVLGFASSPSHQAIRSGWEACLKAEKDAIASSTQGGSAALSNPHAALGSRLFAPVLQKVADEASSLRAASENHIGAVARGLRGVLTEILLLVVCKAIALALIIWLNLRRVAAEKKLKQISRELRASQDRFSRAYESATVGMGIFSLDGTVLSANRKAADILGCDTADLIGIKVSDFMAPECREDHLQKIHTVPNSPVASYQTERRIVRRDGTSAWVRNSVTLLRPEGEEPHYFAISEEITHQKEAMDRLAYLANYDPVTNLPNRRHFEELLVAAIQPAAGFMDCIALLYLEIDSFDFLKGTFGRSVADDVLAELGTSLVAFRREEEVIARLDDQAFVLMFKAAPYDESSIARGTELRDLFHDTNARSKHRIPLSASVGVAYSNNGAGGTPSTRGLHEASRAATTEAENLIKFARAAMLEARSRGGDSIYLADPALQERAEQRHRIEIALLRGLREDEFRVVYQPQFEVETGRLVRFEALCRWTSSELGIIPPDRFIPIAEQTGLIMEIGRRVLLEAVTQALTWSDSGRTIGVAVNISPMQFMRPDFTQHVADVLASSHFPPELLELEITEGIFIRDLNLAIARIRELQRLGLRIALDDFGTGYSSLSYLQRMPIDAVKLDRSFVSDITTDPATLSMVRSVLAMAKALNLRVVTEGVETPQQLEILRDLGCDEAQGYLLGRPESAKFALQRVMESPAYPHSAKNVVRFVS